MTKIKIFTGPGNASERVLWALNIKSVPFELEDACKIKSEGNYDRINPFGYVPTLQVDGQYLSESMAIIEYLEEVYPIPPLFRGHAFALIYSLKEQAIVTMISRE